MGERNEKVLKDVENPLTALPSTPEDPNIPPRGKILVNDTILKE